MLQTILNNMPSPKCVIIHDSLELRGINILHSIIKNHLKLQVNIHVFLFETNPEKLKKLFTNNVSFYDYTKCDIQTMGNGSFLKDIEKMHLNGVIIIDSLCDVILEYGLAETYRMIHKILNKSDQNILQLCTIIHEELFETDSKMLPYFDQISTLKMKLVPLQTMEPRVEYTYKKSAGKIIKEIEEFYYNPDGLFCTRKLQRLDPSVLIPKTEIQPESVASFKIGLNENDKRIKDTFTLPYLKIAETHSSGGNIIYNLDENDDWDEEDPDDDLDI